MKEKFEESLLVTNEKIKAYKKSEDEDERGGIKDEIEQMGKEFVEKGIWSKETAGGVFGLQKEKSDVMEQLHKKIQIIESGGEVSGFTEGESRSVEWNKAGHRAMVVLPSGKKVPATVGELVTDGEWGLNYVLDEGIPKDIKKRFIVAEARRKILSLADEQILKTEMVKKTTKEGGETSPSYLAIYEQEQAKDRQNFQGMIAEKLVKTFFQKNIIDHNLSMKFEEVDVEMDVDKKIDFILHLPERNRGVGSEESDERGDVGVQFTILDASIKKEKEKIEQKKNTVKDAKDKFAGKEKEVDDIVLVSLPLKKLRELRTAWEKDEMRPGGPMKKWNDEQKEYIFRGVLNGLFSQKEITEMWESILGDSPEMGRINKEKESEYNVSNEEKIEALKQKIKEKPEVVEVPKPRIPDEGGQENLNKFANKYGKWLGKKK